MVDLQDAMNELTTAQNRPTGTIRISSAETGAIPLIQGFTVLSGESISAKCIPIIYAGITGVGESSNYFVNTRSYKSAHKTH